MFYSRELPVSGGYDVVVCGAGVAGFTAAVQGGASRCKNGACGKIRYARRRYDRGRK